MAADTPTYAYLLASGEINVSGTLFNFTASGVATISAGPIFDISSALTVIPSVFDDGSALAGTISAVDTTTKIITTAAPHGLTSGQQIKFTNAGGALPAPLAAGTVYYATNVTSTAFKANTAIGTFPTVGLTVVNLSAAGSGTNSVHAGQTAWTIAATSGTLQFPPGFYASTIHWNTIFGSTGHRDQAIAWKVSTFDLTLLTGFLAPVLADPTVRDLRVELRTGAVNGYAFDPTAGGLRVPLGGPVHGLVLFRDTLINFAGDATAVTLTVFPENNFDAPPLLTAAADAVVQFAAADFPNLWGHPCSFLADGRALRAAFAALRALGGPPATALELPCSAVISYTRGGQALRSALFKMIFVQ